MNTPRVGLDDGGRLVVNSGGGAVVKGPYRVTHATPNLTTGVVLFRPAAGDIILKVMVMVTEVFDLNIDDLGGVSVGTAVMLADSAVAPFLGGVSVSAAVAGVIDGEGNFTAAGAGVTYSPDTAVRLATTHPVLFAALGAAPATTGIFDIYVTVLPA